MRKQFVAERIGVLGVLGGRGQGARDHRQNQDSVPQTDATEWPAKRNDRSKQQAGYAIRDLLSIRHRYFLRKMSL
ncbi:MAG: hypothetical protein EA381_01065 [Planctomycetaceae bacterium]|nr:MAG: hypothetical protein EA381_01065 [Planctomycetaceae bacterium]